MSINMPAGLMRASCTWTHGVLAESCKASSVWQEQPCERMIFFSRASDAAALEPRYQLDFTAASR